MSESTIDEVLKRLEPLTTEQLMELLDLIPLNPSPVWVKILIVEKINMIFNQRLEEVE